MSRFGWIDSPAAVSASLARLPHPLFASAARNLRGSGAGKTVLLYKAWIDVLGEFEYQPGQTLGCCVSRASATTTDLLQAVEIAIGKEAEEYKQTSHEFIYGACRQIGNFLSPPGRDGAVGAWAARAVSEVGVVPREWVGPYSDERAGQWGWKGVPAEFRQKAASQKVKTTSQIKSFADLCDATANACPSFVCSDQGFEGSRGSPADRDADGFCAPRGTWNHAMAIIGVRNDQRPGACIRQSWGRKVPGGPTTLGQPDDSFWVDASVIDRMLGQGDSWTFSAFDGYPGQKLPAHWSWSELAA